MTRVDASIPVLAAAIRMSVKTASNCASIISVESSSAAVTATVFCAVTAVRTDTPKPPLAEIERRSAWIPAPPPESDPAMVATTFISPRTACTTEKPPDLGG